MNWLSYKEKLLDKVSVSFRPKGNSMLPKIKSGQLLTVDPIVDYSLLVKGDIVFCKVNGSFYVHLISAIKNDQYQISNNRGRINGWVGSSQIFGKVVRIED